jgi:hypothetical protein
LVFFVFAVSSLSLGSRAWAQSGDDFEEGGPPQEAPFIAEPKLDSQLDQPTVTSPVVSPVVSPTPPARAQETQVQSSGRSLPYQGQRKPRTDEGRITGRELIHHPMSAKGLQRIDKDGTYYYEPITFKPQNETIDVRIGQIKPPPQITAVDGSSSYESMYGTGNPAQVAVDYEWYPLTGWGKLGLQGGAGFFTSHGNGRFAHASGDPSSLCDPATEICDAREVYTFYGIPLSLGVIYRLQVGDRPYFAPYLVGGGSYYLLAEKRDDGKPVKAVGVAAGYGGGGVMFNISAFDRETAFTLESEYGLHNIWISGDYRYVAAANNSLDVSASIISIGLVMDY